MTMQRPGAFAGFRSVSRQTPIPNVFFTQVLPFVDDLVELKVTLFLFNRLSLKKGYPRFVTLREMRGDLDLMSSMALEGRDPAEELSRGLQAVLARGAFLSLALERPEGTDHLYFQNTEESQRAIARVQRGEVDLGALPKTDALPEPPEHRDVFALYEENIGPLSPLITEELREAEQSYPYAWIVEAFREAVRMNRRRWRYIQRILERWQAEGRAHGDHWRSPETIRGRGGAGPGGYIVGGPGPRR